MASVVDSRLRTPKLLSALVLTAVFPEASSILPVAMKNVVGIPLPGSDVGVVTSESAKLCFRDGVGRPPAPTGGRIVEAELPNHFRYEATAGMSCGIKIRPR